MLHNQRGASLIELMIGLVIIGILITIGAPPLSDWIQNMRIRTTAESIVSGLQISRVEAVKRNAMVRFQLAGAGNDSSWTVCVTPSTTSDCTQPGETLIQTRSSASGSTGNVVANTANRALLFNGLGRVTTTGLSGGTSETIDVLLTDSSGNNNCTFDGTGWYRCLRVIVSSAGQVRMCDPSVSLSSSPQGCQ